jgi:hypothetical protein
VVTGASFPLASEEEAAVVLDFLLFDMVEVDVAACVTQNRHISRCCLSEDALLKKTLLLPDFGNSHKQGVKRSEAVFNEVQSSSCGFFK